MQHVNRVTGEDGNDDAGEISSKARNRKMQKDVHASWNCGHWKALGFRIVNKSTYEILDAMAKASRFKRFIS